MPGLKRKGNVYTLSVELVGSENIVHKFSILTGMVGGSAPCPKVGRRPKKTFSKDI